MRNKYIMSGRCSGKNAKLEKLCNKKLVKELIKIDKRLRKRKLSFEEKRCLSIRRKVILLTLFSTYGIKR